MELKTYYKEDGKEYVANYGVEKSVDAADTYVNIYGVNYVLKHANAPKKIETIDDPKPEVETVKIAKKKTSKRKK